MTRSASTSQETYRQCHYGSRFTKISDEDQSTYLNSQFHAINLLPSITVTTQPFVQSYSPLLTLHITFLLTNVCVMMDLFPLPPCLEAPPNRESMSDMNENLSERFGRGKALRDSHMPRSPTAKPSVALNLSIREYAKTDGQPADLSHWTGFREIPSPSEVFDKGRIEHSAALELTENTVVGPYTSKEEYLESHYRLLREDAVAPLRDVVSEVQYMPQVLEKDSDNNAYIYEKVT